MSFQNQFEESHGTLLYNAPEISKGHYTCKVDMWALGIIYYRMLFNGNFPDGNFLDGNFPERRPLFKHKRNISQ